jgi:hypothetical protein
MVVVAWVIPITNLLGGRINSNGFKSATTAGLLGIFFGAVGAHCWYLGDKKSGTKHMIIFGIGVAIMIVAGAIIPSVVSFWTLYRISWLITLLNVVGWLAIGISEVWGFIEGIQILTGGDAGLTQKGYRVTAGVQSFGGQNGSTNNQARQSEGQNQNNIQNGQWGGYNG